MEPEDFIEEPYTEDIYYYEEPVIVWETYSPLPWWYSLPPVTVNKPGNRSGDTETIRNNNGDGRNKDDRKRPGGRRSRDTDPPNNVDVKSHTTDSPSGNNSGNTSYTNSGSTTNTSSNTSTTSSGNTRNTSNTGSIRNSGTRNNSGRR